MWCLCAPAVRSRRWAGYFLPRAGPALRASHGEIRVGHTSGPPVRAAGSPGAAPPMPYRRHPTRPNATCIRPRLSRRSPDASEVIARDQHAVRGYAHPLPSSTDRRLHRHPRHARWKSLDIDDPGQHRSHAEIPHAQQLRYPGRRELLRLNDPNVARQNDRARCFAPGAYSQPPGSDHYLGTNPYLP